MFGVSYSNGKFYFKNFKNSLSLELHLPKIQFKIVDTKEGDTDIGLEMNTHFYFSLYEYGVYITIKILGFGFTFFKGRGI